MLKRVGLGIALPALVAMGAGCTAMKIRGPKAPAAQRAEQTPDYTPVPTVPSRTPTPANAKPLPTRPIKNPAAEKAKKAGKAIGPVITFLGISRADGKRIKPIGVEKGRQVYRSYVGSGFFLIVEGKPGLSSLEIARSIRGRGRTGPDARPDLQVQANRDLGDGSAAVCDRRRPVIGGIPAINPPSFKQSKKITDALNDFACRFETFLEPESACTVNKFGDFAFMADDSATQFCMVAARAWRFPVGDTIVSARLRDSEGNPGPVKRFILRRPKERPKRKKPKPIAKPTPPRRRP